jgi:hypothetical protein
VQGGAVINSVSPIKIMFGFRKQRICHRLLFHFVTFVLFIFLFIYCCSVWYDILVNCNWVATRWQLYNAHLHTNSTQNDTKQTNKLVSNCVKAHRRFNCYVPSSTPVSRTHRHNSGCVLLNSLKYFYINYRRVLSH